MMSRGRHSQSQGWDSMREDNDTTYDAQYPDDEVKSGGVQLDHCKLYITNVNQALNEEGLRAAFMPYGTIAKVYLSNDPSKKYALITYETPGEAKMAMMKLNRTEPLKLNIHFAHKSKPRERRYNNNRQESGSYRNDNRQESGSYRNDISRQESDNYRSDNISLSSHGRRSINQDDYTNGGYNDMGIDEDDEDMDFDPELDLERKKMIEQLELDRLKLCEEQVKCQQRMIYLEKKAGKKPMVQNPIKNAPAVPNPIKRCILPDGRVVIRNDSNRNADHQPDSAFNSAAGDSSLPALQRVGARHCLRCGKAADAYCAQCGVAPYCGQRCQEIDWVQRHRNVCHNLARTSQGTAEVSKEVKPVEQVGMPDFPAPAPLRRPRSPAPSVNKRDFKDDNNDRAKKTFTSTAQMKNNANLNVRDGGNSRGGNSRGGKSRGGGQPRGGTNQADRRPRQNDGNVDEEDDTWDLKDNRPSRATEAVTAAPAQKPFVPKPKPDPVPQKSYQQTKKEPEVPKVETVQQRLYQATKKEPEVPKVETVAQRYQPEKKEPEVPKVEPAAEVSYKPSVSVADTAPKMKTVPVKYLIETLSIGDVCVLTIDAQASECRSKSSGYVCLSLHEAKQLDFALLCEEDFTNDCEAAADYKPNPGDLFSYRNPEDGLFYRARRLDATSVALIDSSRVVTISAADVCKKIPAKYEDIVEFCCLLDAADVKVGDSVKITLKSKTADGYNVQIDNSGTQSDGKVSRWVPLVEVPQPATKPVTGPVEVQVPRPEVKHKSTVLLVEAPAMDRVLVRPADTESVRRFDAVLQDVAQYGFHATPITEPPQKGQMVIGKFSDGLCYRALCIRTNVKANKFMLEYVEFGNVAISPKESIYACPQQWDLSAAPTVVSVVQLGAQYALTGDAALEYIESVREAEFLLTLPNGAASAPSGAEVHLALSKNGESVNQKLLMMCKPDWKKIEESGGDVLDVRPIMLSDLEYVSLPAGGCEVEVLDVSMLASGALSGCERAPGRSVCDAIEPVSKQMEAYCNSELGQQPYLPSFEELCIAKCGPNQQWYRAALCEQVGGPGGAAARVLLVDYGNLETVPVSALRKMLPEFVRGVPALAPQLEIQGWPTTHTKDMLQRALKHMRVTKEGRGVLKVTRCQQRMHGLYLVHAPELLEAMAAND